MLIKHKKQDVIENINPTEEIKDAPFVFLLFYSPCEPIKHKMKTNVFHRPISAYPPSSTAMPRERFL